MTEKQPPKDAGAFDLEPLPEPETKPEPEKPVPTLPAARPVASPPEPAPPHKPGLLGKLGGMLEGFDDDADFERDPEVERALGKGPKPVPIVPAAEAPSRPPLISPELGPANLWVGAGAVLLLGAVIGAAVFEDHRPVVASLLTVYNAALHTCTGVLALGATAMLLRRPLGAIEQGAARMFASVCAFLVLANLRIDLIGTTAWEELALGTLAYGAVLAMAFRLWRRPLMYVVCTHFFLWMAVQIGMQLSAWMATKP